MKMDDEKKEKPEATVFTGPKCHDKKCCGEHEGYIIKENDPVVESKIPPYHDGCDCKLISRPVDRPCQLCGKRCSDSGHMAVDFKIQFKKTVPPMDIRYCGKCLVFLFELINGLMRQGIWEAIVAQQKPKAGNKIIVPGMIPPKDVRLN